MRLSSTLDWFAGLAPGCEFAPENLGRSQTCLDFWRTALIPIPIPLKRCTFGSALA